MKKTEYAELHQPETHDKLQEIEAGKYGDYELPEFTKEVPVSSRKSESRDNVSIEYKWNDVSSPSVKVQHIEFKKDEDLAELHRIAARDGADSICFRHNNHTYILRKTVKEIARALLNTSGKVSGVLEIIVGYLKSLLGNYYVISRIEGESWAFDRRIAKQNVSYVDSDTLDRKNKSKLIEMITEKISQLHSNNLIIGRFSLANILLGERDLRITDLRRMRVSRRRSFVVEELKSIMQYLLALEFATREDIYAAVTYYVTHNEKSCSEWYNEKTGKKTDDQLDIIDRIEEEIYA